MTQEITSTSFYNNSRNLVRKASLLKIPQQDNWKLYKAEDPYKRLTYDELEYGLGCVRTFYIFKMSSLHQDDIFRYKAGPEGYVSWSKTPEDLFGGYGWNVIFEFNVLNPAIKYHNTSLEYTLWMDGSGNRWEAFGDGD